MVSSLTPNAPMMSLAPFNGLLVNVPSPLTVAFPSPSTAISGIISRARSPDSPALIVSGSNAAAPRPFIVNVELSLTTFPSLYASPTVTSAPRALATEMADSLSPHGEYPFNVVVPSANAAAIIARWAKLLDEGIWISAAPGPLSMSEEVPVSSEALLAVALTVASAVLRLSAFRRPAQRRSAAVPAALTLTQFPYTMSRISLVVICPGAAVSSSFSEA